MSEDEVHNVEVSDRDFTILVVAFVALTFTLALVIFNLVSVARQSASAAATHAAVCVYRADLQSQATQSQTYLNQHPQGLPALGISAAQIQQGIARERDAVASLSGLHCNN